MDSHIPRFDIQLLFEEIGVRLDENQYRDVISLVDMYHVYLRKRQVRFICSFRKPSNVPRLTSMRNIDHQMQNFLPTSPKRVSSLQVQLFSKVYAIRIKSGPGNILHSVEMTAIPTSNFSRRSSLVHWLDW